MVYHKSRFTLFVLILVGVVNQDPDLWRALQIKSRLAHTFIIRPQINFLRHSLGLIPGESSSIAYYTHYITVDINTDRFLGIVGLVWLPVLCTVRIILYQIF